MFKTGEFAGYFHRMFCVFPKVSGQQLFNLDLDFNRSENRNMKLKQYEFRINQNKFEYEFNSEGPNGIIKKIVRFSQISTHGFSYYNLSFGDWNNETGSIDDFVVSNNKDAEQILITVAATVISFTNLFPDAIIYSEGSTDSRTRLYQIGINKYWQEISPLFEVYGLAENEGLVPFEQNRRFKAFIGRRKLTNFKNRK